MESLEMCFADHPRSNYQSIIMIAFMA